MDHLRATITTHDAGFRLTEADFDLAHRIDAIVAAHQELPLD
ncbi:4a-hydroxytetrahydrobiopterin dehydratase [Streptomyces exfoliatus]